MATLVLTTAANAVASAGAWGPIATAALTAGASIAGQLIDNALFGSGQSIQQVGPRLSDVQITSSTEGTPIPRAYGRARLAGQLIWATRFKEAVTRRTESVGGKGGGGGQSVTTTEYSYSVSFALALCEGEATTFGQVWADGKPLDLSTRTVRFYRGTEDQAVDSKISAVEGAGNAPAYRGLCYIVFEDFALAAFGNRIPQITVEVIKAFSADADDLESLVRGVDILPGSGEFALATSRVVREDGRGGATGENLNNNVGEPDWTVSFDQLQELAPDLEAGLLVVSWFGDDLRCADIEIKPRIERSDKSTIGLTWSVQGITRGSAETVSTDGDGRPNFGGTPSDNAVVEAITDLKARGLAVTFYPFLLMDIETGNALPDPYGDAEQAAFPWRGRITCTPAPGVSGTVDQTADADTQVAAFFGTAAAGDFAVSGTSVTYSGPAEWSYRRFILHYAHLCAAVGGIDAFVIGSEMKYLTRVRGASGNFPAVDAFKTLAADVSGILGSSVKIGYAADWSEFHHYAPEDGSGDLFFNLDPLWSDANIDFIGIDNYMPLADWRDGTGHADYDAVTGPTKPTDLAYLKGNIEGGELFDWVYESSADRDDQTRTTIADPVYGKPWVFRLKDLRSWWQNQHYDRPGGVEETSPTSWVPESKPFWFTELGCPAVDKGANQPNVFYDPKSSESAFPYYSTGRRDDLMQRRFLEAHLQYWKPDAGNNPYSTALGDYMIAWDRIFLWTWDARPYPAFPVRTATWSDGDNWRLGHWLNGRLGLVPLSLLVEEICGFVSGVSVDASALNGLVTGFVLDKVMSPREALIPLMQAFQFDAAESGATVIFAPRGGLSVATLTEDDLALEGQTDTDSHFELTRAQASELPRAVSANFIEASADYRQANVEARRLTVASETVLQVNLPIVAETSYVQGVVNALLMDAWAQNEKAVIGLPPSRIAIDPTDIVSMTLGGRSREMRVDEIADGMRRRVALTSIERSVYDIIPGSDRQHKSNDLQILGKPLVVFADLPLLTGTETPHAATVAAYASPWPGTVNIYRSPTTSGYLIDTQLTLPAILGETVFGLYSGSTGRWDHGNIIDIDLYSDQLASKEDIQVLNGANAIAVENADGDWEILQFANAELQYGNVWRLSKLLRGQAGTEGAMRDPVAGGARVLVIDSVSLAQLGTTIDQRTNTYNYRYGPSGRDIGDATYETVSKSFTGVGLRPLSPAHVRRSRGSGDITISWHRRDRIGADDWEQAEIPMSESAESYEIEIYDNASPQTVLRTLTSSSESVVYTSAMQTADWGGAAPEPFTVAVYQISSVYGRGEGRRENLYLLGFDP